MQKDKKKDHLYIFTTCVCCNFVFRTIIPSSIVFRSKMFLTICTCDTFLGFLLCQSDNPPIWISFWGRWSTAGGEKPKNIYDSHRHNSHYHVCTTFSWDTSKCSSATTCWHIYLSCMSFEARKLLIYKATLALPSSYSLSQGSSLLSVPKVYCWIWKMRVQICSALLLSVNEMMWL